jgi:hypothetical protein
MLHYQTCNDTLVLFLGVKVQLWISVNLNYMIYNKEVSILDFILKVSKWLNQPHPIVKKVIHSCMAVFFVLL